MSNLPGKWGGMGWVGWGPGRGEPGGLCEKRGALPGQEHLELFL